MVTPPQHKAGTHGTSRVSNVCYKKKMLLQKLFYPFVKVVGHDMNPADVVV